MSCLSSEVYFYRGRSRLIRRQIMNLSVAAISFASLAPKVRVARALRLPPSVSHHSAAVSPHRSTPFTRRWCVLQTSSFSSSANSIMSESIYWNREKNKNALPTSNAHDGPTVKEARILALSDPNDSHNMPLYCGPLPEGVRLLKVGSRLDDFDEPSIMEQHPNVIFVSHPLARDTLIQLLEKFPSVEWVHTRSAGVDFIASNALFASHIMLTNAKGMFSSTLAEYCMMACSYFAKDLTRLMRQKADVNWEQYPIRELRGATMGIVGYGDIGRACAKLAKAYGMKVVGLKRDTSTFRKEDDPYCDDMYGMEGLHELMSLSDYILIATPLTEQTRGLISKEAISKCKASAVIINVGRGPIIDEEALIEALQNGTIHGAALDVFSVEPLREDSPLWKLDNVLLSPHNMDMTLTFMRESTEFFISENLPRFVRGKLLLNPVNKEVGY